MKKRIFIPLIIVIFIIIVLSILLTNKVNNINIEVKEDYKITRTIKKDYKESGPYKIEEGNVYSVVDPYSIAPLSGLVMFETSKPAEVSVLVNGHDDVNDIEYTIEGYNKNHEIPIYGLYENELTEVELLIDYKDGDVLNYNLQLQGSEIVNKDINIEVINTSDTLNGSELYFLIGQTNHIYGYDNAGELRYVYEEEIRSGTFVEIFDGHIYYTNQNYEIHDDSLIYTSMLGQTKAIYELNTRPHHDGIIKDDMVYMLVDVPEYEKVETGLLILNLKNGRYEIINLFTLLDQERVRYIGNRDEDPIHLNSIVFDDNNNMIISSRNQSAVFSISPDLSEINWILAHDSYWQEEFSQYILEPDFSNLNVDDEILVDYRFYPWGQHNVEILPDLDGNEDTLEISMYDNQKCYINPDDVELKSYDAYFCNPDHSYIKIYSIDETNKKYQLLYYYELKEKSEFMSNAQYLDSTFLSGSGEIKDQSRGDYIGYVVEIDIASGEVLFEAYTDHFYKTVKKSIF